MHCNVDFSGFSVYNKYQSDILPLLPVAVSVMAIEWWLAPIPALAGDSGNVTQSWCHPHDASSHCHQSEQRANTWAMVIRTEGPDCAPVIQHLRCTAQPRSSVSCVVHIILAQRKYKVLWGYSNCWGSYQSLRGVFKKQVRCRGWCHTPADVRILISVCLISIFTPPLYWSQVGWPAPVLLPSYFTINLWSSLDVKMLAILIKIRFLLSKLYISNQAWLAHFYHSSNGIEYFTFYTVYHFWWK